MRKDGVGPRIHRTRKRESDQGQTGGPSGVGKDRRWGKENHYNFVQKCHNNIKLIIC